MESDRNTAPPTESAVCGKQGLGTLRSRLSEPHHMRQGNTLHALSVLRG